MKVDWDKINNNLPYTKSKADKQKRDKMFKDMDPNGNGYVSLAEADKALLDMGDALKPLFEEKGVILRAFNAAKAKQDSKAEVGDDFIQKSEFRYFLLYLRQYFEYKVMFDEIDSSNDGKVGLKEFE